MVLVKKFRNVRKCDFCRILQLIQVKKGVACHAHTDYRIDPKISEKL